MKKWIGFVLLIMLLAACSEENPSAGAGETLEEVEVEFNTESSADPGEEIELSATVTQGEEAVEDADEVVFEVWRSGEREYSEMLEGAHQEMGIYTQSHQFEEEGLYFIQAHTTARRMHVMPKMKLTVGNPDPDTIIPDDSDDADSMEKMEHGH